MTDLNFLIGIEDRVTKLTMQRWNIQMSEVVGIGILTGYIVSFLEASSPGKESQKVLAPSRCHTLYENYYKEL